MKKLKIIKKKLWPEYYDLIISGKKKFELRLADFEVAEGDILLLEEFDPKTKQYTGRSIKKKVSYISTTKGMEQMHSKEEINEHGFYVLSLEDKE